jgi:hypothetical protein
MHSTIAIILMAMEFVSSGKKTIFVRILRNFGLSLIA